MTISVTGPQGKLLGRGQRFGYCLIAGIALGAGGLHAQEAPAGDDTSNGAQLEEVVVTAQRRSENIQRVPIAVSAFTADTLASRNLANVQALGALAPGVNLDAGAPFSGDRSVLSASIRGVGQDDFAFNMNPAVGVYVDGVYLARTIGANQNLLDVDRVEILKGPQGTLFGANTEGGAISITTRTPGNDLKVTAQVTGGSFDRRDIAFSADLPIIKDTLLSTLTVSSQNRNGYVKVLPYPESVTGGQAFVVDPDTVYPKSSYSSQDNYGGYGVQTIRGKLLWNLDDKTSVTFGADWNHQDQSALPYTVMQTFSGNLNASTFSTLYNLCIGNTGATINRAVATALGIPAVVPDAELPPIVSSFSAYCSRPRSQVSTAANVGFSNPGGAALLGSGFVGAIPTTLQGLVQPNLQAGSAGYAGSSAPRLLFTDQTAGVGNDIDSTYASGTNLARNDYFGFSVTGQHEFNDDLSLKSITAYRQIKWIIGTDLDGSPETFQEVSDHQHQWQVSEEVQINGKAFDGNLNYVGGLYYFKEKGYVHDYVPFESILYVYDFSNDVDTQNIAPYIHADYKWNNWGFTAGGRFPNVQTKFEGGQGDLNGFSPGCAIGTDVGTGHSGPCVAVDPSTPGYIPGASYVAPGYPVDYFPGGAAAQHKQSWNIFDPTLGAQYHFNNDVMAYLSWGKGFKAGGWTTRLSALNVPYEDTTYQPEYTKTWELGLKSSWLNHRLQANAALFYTDFTNIQLNVQKGISPVYMNAGNAKIKGAELELRGVIGGGLTMNVAASYIDAYYTYVNPKANIPQSIAADGTNTCPSTELGGIPPAPICAIQSGNALDAKLPKTPKYKVSFYPEYDFLLPNEANIRLIVDYTITASMYNDSLNTPQLYRPVTHMANGSVHYVTGDERYDVAVGVTNITNDRFITGGSPNIGAGEVGGYYNEPREWYLQLTAKLK